MVKGISRRVVVVDAPDPRFFEQAIFIVRNETVGEGVSSQALVEEARRVASKYAAGERCRFLRGLDSLHPLVYALMGGGITGLAWLLVSVL